MKAKEFSLPDQEGRVHNLSDYKGKWVVLYFYPKDDTPGCTKEACNFRDSYNEIAKLGVQILGISKDTVKSHKKFAEKYELPFMLLSDTKGDMIEAYGAWGEKSMFGRHFMGLQRMSYLIGPDGIITKIYPKVDPANHALEILKDIKLLTS